MPSVFALFGSIDLKTNNFEKKLSNAEMQMRGFNTTAQKTSVGVNNLGVSFNKLRINTGAVKSYSSALGGIAATAAAAAVAFEYFSTVAQTVGSLAAESIRLGAAFESVHNSIKVFSGSTAKANQELEALEKTVFSSTGLRLENAQKGYQNLRALGFQANIAKGFLKELGEEKIFSGASDEALGKIVFNFGQILSGGQKVSQELREILTQMPSLRKAFFEAFGSLDPNVIQSAFDDNANGALEKFIATLEKGKSPILGLNDAVGKFSDAWIVMGQKFAEPIVPELSKILQDLTKVVLANKSAFVTGGKNIADSLKSIRENVYQLTETLDLLRNKSGI